MPGAVTAVLARVRYIDDYLAASIHDGYRQVIILGAGYDTRAYRFDFLQNDVRFFELDHPMTQQEKKCGIRKIFGVLPRHVVYVPIDFEKESLLEKLNAEGYDETLKTLFIWEGVTKYLSQEAVEAVLAFVVKHATEGSSIIFDYVYRSIISGNADETVFGDTSEYQDKVNEPFRFGIEKSTLSMYITAQGFSKVDNITLHDLEGLFDCAKRRRWPDISFGGIACATV